MGVYPGGNLGSAEPIYGATDMATIAVLSIEQYLRTSYNPDCEYLDGELKEKALGGFPHGNTQVILGSWFQAHSREWQIKVAVATRTRVAGDQVRLPDLVIVPWDASVPYEALVTAPLIAIEVLSPSDAYTDLRQRARDLRTMGTPNIWLVDPAERTIALSDGQTWQPFDGVRLQAAGTEAYLDLAWLWNEFS